MKNRIASTALTVAALCFTAATINAGPVQRADIPAEPVWVAHLDMDAVRPSMVGQFLMEQLQKPDAENKLAAFQAMFHFDPRTALHGISLYSSSQNSEDGVLIVYADFDAARLVTLAKAAREYQCAMHRSHTIHNWIDDKKKPKDGEKPRTYAAIAGKRVVFGQKQQSVAAALEVMDGYTGSLTTTGNFALLGSPAKGKFMQVAGRKIQAPGGNPSGALLKLSEEIRLEIGEADGQVNALLTLQARDEEVAGQLNAVAQGLVALMKLNTEKPGQARFAESVQMNLKGNEVTATMTMPAFEVVNGLRAMSAKKAARQSEQ